VKNVEWALFWTLWLAKLIPNWWRACKMGWFFSFRWSGLIVLREQMRLFTHGAIFRTFDPVHLTDMRLEHYFWDRFRFYTDCWNLSWSFERDFLVMKRAFIRESLKIIIKMELWWLARTFSAKILPPAHAGRIGQKLGHLPYTSWIG